MKRFLAHLEICRLGSVLAALAFSAPASAACGAAAAPAAVAEVTDRLEIRLADGRMARLAGLDPADPRRGDPQTAAAARRFLSDHLTGQNVTLVIFSPKPDRWGRAEAKAREAGLGLWNDPDYSILDATDVEELAQQDGRFVIVEGVVRRVGTGRARFYLDFGGRGGFTVVVARKSQNAFQAAGASLTGLAGEKIRVRGVLDDRFGPRLEITEPPMLERLGRGEAGEGTKPGG
jgi:micrococcal nuclease